MPHPGGPVHNHHSDHLQLERELADLEVEVWGLEAQLGNLPPATRANTEVELTRLRGRIAALRPRLGR